MEKKNFYCEYCGKRFPDIRQLTSATCTRHPDGSHKGRHKLYEGSEKREYTCKYCGKKVSFHYGHDRRAVRQSSKGYE